MANLLSKFKILIVDDEPIVREFLFTLMSKDGHECESCGDGAEALEILEERGFDAVITDVKMPNMDGIKLTAAIAKIYVDIPVMVITAYTEEYSAADALEVGASEFLYKPVDAEELLLRFYKMMRNHHILSAIKDKKKALAHKSSKMLQEANKKSNTERQALEDEIRQLKKQLEEKE